MDEEETWATENEIFAKIMVFTKCTQGYKWVYSNPCTIQAHKLTPWVIGNLNAASFGAKAASFSTFGVLRVS
jgi:hypothetical protein